MPTNRFQFSDDFVLNNGNVGINSTSPQAKLDVVSSVNSDNLRVTGISSFTSYEGFLNNNQNINQSITISGDRESGSLSGEIIVGTGVTVTVASGATSSQGFIDSLKVYNTFTVPVGGTADRPSKSTPGQLFFNRDFATMEFWDGNVWRQVDNTTQSGRGVFGAGFSSGAENMEYINISTLGNSVIFGTYAITTGLNGTIGGAASETRGIWSGGTGTAPARTATTIDYITIASQGNSISFGSLATSKYVHGVCSSSTRGIFGGGQPGSTNVIEYLQISTLGNALDFGDLTNLTQSLSSSSSPTRGLFFGGTFPGSPTAYFSSIDAVTISSTGNAVRFGDLTSKALPTSCSSGTEAYIRIHSDGTSRINSIDKVTISTFGNAVDFGDSTVKVSNSFAAVSNRTRGVFGGGSDGTNTINTIEYITFSSSGNAQDFGDLSKPMGNVSAVCDSHGGLGGF